MAWNHGVNVEHALNQDQRLATLRAWASDPMLIKQLMSEQLWQHQHRLWAIGEPDPHFQQRLDQAESTLISSLSDSMSEKQANELRVLSQDLLVHQSQEVDDSVLPRLAYEDIPQQRPYANGTIQDGFYHYQQPSNGLLQYHLAIPLPELTSSDLILMPLLTQIVGNLGTNNYNYKELAVIKEEQCSSLGASFQLSANFTNHRQISPWLMLHVNGLARKASDMASLLTHCWQEQRFDELPRLQELLQQRAAGIQQRLLPQGSRFALQAAQHQLGLPSSLQFDLSGIGHLHHLRHWLSDEAHLQQAVERVQQLWQSFQNLPYTAAIIGDLAHDEAVMSAAQKNWQPQKTFR